MSTCSNFHLWMSNLLPARPIHSTVDFGDGRLLKVRLVIRNRAFRKRFNRTHEDVAQFLERFIQSLVYYLYGSSSSQRPHLRGITIHVLPMDGVAFTEGSTMSGWKFIYISVKHVLNRPVDEQEYEFQGVLAHELTHCFQHTGMGSASKGFIEGLADYIRIRMNVPAKHWKLQTSSLKKWDEGYEKTGAFMKWLDDRHPGAIISANLYLKSHHWDTYIFRRVANIDVKEEWSQFCQQYSQDVGVNQ